MSLKNLCTAMFALTMTGCASLSEPPDLPAIPANLRLECPPVAPPNDGKGATIMKWSVSLIELYRECQSRHKRLVEAWPADNKAKPR